VPFLRLQSSWMLSPYLRARPKERRRRKRLKPLNNNTQSSLLTGSLLSPRESNTSSAETGSHQQARHPQHPRTPHLLHVLDLLGFLLHSLRAKIAEVALGPRFQMDLTVGRRLHLGSGRRGKQETSMRIPHLPNGGSTGLRASGLVAVLCLLCVI